jgi:hypothetical protein
VSTFIVRCLDTEAGRGRVRHVSTGEEANFGSPEELFDFMERMNAQEGALREPEEQRSEE